MRFVLRLESPRKATGTDAMTAEDLQEFGSFLISLSSTFIARILEILGDKLVDIGLSFHHPQHWQSCTFEIPSIYSSIHQECNCSWTNSGGDETACKAEVQRLSVWCSRNDIELNRTKELKRTPSLSLHQQGLCRKDAVI